MRTAARTAGSVLLVYTIAAVISSLFELHLLDWLLRTWAPTLLLGLSVLFAPELRRGLEQICGRGSGGRRP